MDRSFSAAILVDDLRTRLNEPRLIWG